MGNKAASNVLKIMHSLGWQGGTVHQLEGVTGLSIIQIHTLHDHKALDNWSFNQGKLFGSLGYSCADLRGIELDFKYDKCFWSGVINN